MALVRPHRLAHPRDRERLDLGPRRGGPVPHGTRQPPLTPRQQEAGFVPFGTGFTNPDFAAVAEAMGAKGIRVEDPGDVAEGLAAALAHTGGPVVVDVLVDPYALAVPAHVPARTTRRAKSPATYSAISGDGGNSFSVTT
ncbi:thiamine pyrophosphate-dependent enzyme [Streptomyces sp. R39]|uniref:Thiamine pyrophosphate-dependent enzyme n=1 Tax=Streptomyces sp. R39 TaxID=3238631 RepID=A0AB39R1H3_9ACTN